MTRLGYTFMTILVVGACTDGLSDQPDDSLPPGDTAGGQGNTFNHDNSYIDPFTLLNRLQIEGPARYTSHMHHCSKVRIANLGNILTDLGVNLGNTNQVSAGGLYASGVNALGAANFPNRIRETVLITTSAASREFDIFAAAAPEIITAMPNLARCQVNGVGPTMFDASGTSCSPAGISCLIGAPATSGHVELCNHLLQPGVVSTPANAKNLAVAAMLAAAYTCE
jgi:hypothetical protein